MDQERSNYYRVESSGKSLKTRKNIDKDLEDLDKLRSGKLYLKENVRTALGMRWGGVC